MRWCSASATRAGVLSILELLASGVFSAERVAEIRKALG
jgi:hypothetical protein